MTDEQVREMQRELAKNGDFWSFEGLKAACALLETSIEAADELIQRSPATSFLKVADNE